MICGGPHHILSEETLRGGGGVGGTRTVGEEIGLRGRHIVCKDTDLRGPFIVCNETDLRKPPIVSEEKLTIFYSNPVLPYGISMLYALYTGMDGGNLIKL